MDLKIFMAKRRLQGFVGEVLAYSAGLYAHSLEVASLSALLAYEVGLNQQEVEEVTVGGLLHDVGKIRLSRTILEKQGSLNEVEWREVQRHPEHGVKMLEENNRELASLIRYHHERWDGRGYMGCKGNDVPMGARIIALADSFSAMTTNRPYHNARSFWDCLEELEGGSGSQFDPIVVKAFLGLALEDLAKARKVNIW